MRRYAQRHLDRLGQRCRAAVALVKGSGWPGELALGVTHLLGGAESLIVDAEMRLGEETAAQRLLSRAELEIRRAHRRLGTAYRRRQVPGAAYKRLGGELLGLLASLRAVRKGSLAPSSPQADP